MIIVNLIWAFMAIVGIVYAMFNGTMGDVNKALFESANEAVTLSIGLISVLVFWLGMMNIAKHAGVLDKLATLFKPFIHWLFPDIPKGHPAIGYILSNFTANLFGIGTAATTMGLKEMEYIKRLDVYPIASHTMNNIFYCNISSVTFLPMLIIDL